MDAAVDHPARLAQRDPPHQQGVGALLVVGAELEHLGVRPGRPGYRPVVVGQVVVPPVGNLSEQVLYLGRLLGGATVGADQVVPPWADLKWLWVT
jgi:hypothetical protein